MRLSGIIFDLDGTLVDSLAVSIRLFQQAILAHGGRAYTHDEIVATFGPSEEGTLLATVPDTWEAATETYFAGWEAAHTDQITVFPGVAQVLADLAQRGFHLGLVTGKSARGTAITLERLRLRTHFDVVETGSRHGSVKVAAIRRVLEHWGLPADQAAYVGDAPTDIAAAREVGVLPVAARWASLATVSADETPLHFLSVATFAAWTATLERVTNPPRTPNDRLPGSGGEPLMGGLM